ncbi:MAG: UDP-N-acetylmuramoyl-tripeptide--D-alanyl-D-alanine ligase [Pseudomonadota bacterium]
MIRMTLLQVAAAVNGVLYGKESAMIAGLFTDTRKPVAGALFVALRGPNFDAHDFVNTALEGGAAAVLVERRVEVDIPQIVVEDTRIALGRLAAAWREQWGGKLIALTGSNGKTTTKEMLASILRQAGPTLATRGNLNNDIGVPLMLAELDDIQAYAVIEMGANHQGEIDYLSAMARPDVALVTNTGRAHLEGFGGPQGVILAKGEIYGGLRQDGTAIINADDAGAPVWMEFNQGRALTFGMNAQADVQGAWRPGKAGVRLEIQAGSEGVAIELAVAGEHNARNALAAATAALALGLDFVTIKAGLEAFGGVPGRLQRKRGLNGCVLWDDTYNANPDSLRAGIRAVAAQGHETWLVLGDMGELGADSAALHTESGALARELGVARLFTLGQLAARAADSFGSDAKAFDDIDALLAALRGTVRSGIHILIKGSRSSRMERVTQALEETSC